MTVLNNMAFLALFALVVPIAVHLHKRRRARVVEWTAMQFLTASVASRRRGMTLEHFLLLLCRCLLLALFVLAMARPVLNSAFATNAWGAMLLGGIALISLTAALVSFRGKHRLIALTVAGLLCFGAAQFISVADPEVQNAGEARDLVIVVDHSLSMTLESDGHTPFASAIAEAETLIEALPGGSTVSLVSAGPVIHVEPGSPFRNLSRAQDSLATLSPVAGGTDLSAAVARARQLANLGTNASKQVVLFSDNQLRAWQDASAHALGDSDESTVGVDDTAPETEIGCFARISDLAGHRNLAVTKVESVSTLAGTHSPVPIDIDVLNGGAVTHAGVALKLLVDDREITSELTGPIEPGTHVTVRFRHKFQTEGRHVVTGMIEEPDALPADNRCESVVSVVGHIPVLIVNGNQAADRFLRSATFTQFALDPIGARLSQEARDDKIAEESTQGRPALVDVVDATELGELESWENYQIIALSEVPRLSTKTAARLARFVTNGGGLLIQPGREAELGFYNNWVSTGTGSAVLPALLHEHRRADRPRGPGLGLDPDIITLAPLEALIQRGEHDLSELEVWNHWRVQPVKTATVGARLTNGAPLFLEHSMGRGRVLLQTVSLNPDESNLATRVSFPVLMHLWVQHLAAADRVTCNFEPSPDLTLELFGDEWKSNDSISMHLLTPKGISRPVQASVNDAGRLIHVGLASEAGVYGLQADEGAPVSTRFSVSRDPHESDLTPATTEQLNRLAAAMGIQRIDDVKELQESLVASAGRLEIWKPLAYAVLWLMAGEALVGRWITNRRAVTAEPQGTKISPEQQGTQTSDRQQGDIRGSERQSSTPLDSLRVTCMPGQGDRL